MLFMGNLVDILCRAPLRTEVLDLGSLDTSIYDNLFELSQLIDRYFEEQTKRGRIQFYSYGFAEFVSGLSEGFNQNTSFERTPFYYNGHETGERLRDRMKNQAIAASYQKLVAMWREVIAAVREELVSIEFAVRDPCNFLLDRTRDSNNQTAPSLEILFGRYIDLVEDILHGKSLELEQAPASSTPLERHIKFGLIYLFGGRIGPAQYNFRVASTLHQNGELARVLNEVSAGINEAYTTLKPHYDLIKFAQEFDRQSNNPQKFK